MLDTVRLRVTEDGLIEARATGNGIVVVSKLQIGPVTHVDTTLVRVVAAAPTFPLDTLSIQPPALDSAIWSWGGAPKTLQPITKSTSGGNISGLQIAWTSSNKRVATVEANGATNAILTGWMVGKVWIRATTYAWGVALSDSVEYIIGYPAEQLIEVDNVVDPDGTSRIVFHPSTVTIGVGGVVTWDYSTGGFGLSIPGITFEQPDEAFGVVDYALLWPLIDARDGNVDPRERLVHPLTGSWFGASNMRFWKTPGVYTFWDNMNRGTGVVIVKGRPDV